MSGGMVVLAIGLGMVLRVMHLMATRGKHRAQRIVARAIGL